jgi:AcrR family transcriptional regulator
MIVSMSDERVEQILDAAYACFTRHGIKRTSMDDIAREVGMSRSAVYQYVRNKEDAYRRLAERLFDAALAQARQDAGSGRDLAERLTAVLMAKLDLTLRLWHDSPAHAAELLGVNARLSADLDAAYNDAMRELLVGIITADRHTTDAAEPAEVLLALTRGLEADLSDPDVPARRLRYGVALLVAGLPDSNSEERS